MHLPHLHGTFPRRNCWTCLAGVEQFVWPAITDEPGPSWRVNHCALRLLESQKAYGHVYIFLSFTFDPTVPYISSASQLIADLITALDNVTEKWAHYLNLSETHATKVPSWQQLDHTLQMSQNRLISSVYQHKPTKCKPCFMYQYFVTKLIQISVPTKQQVMALLLIHEDEDRQCQAARTHSLDSVVKFISNAMDLKCIQSVYSLLPD